MDLEIRLLQNALRRSGQEVVILDKDFVRTLYSCVINLMAYFIYDSNGRHYICIFCDADAVGRGLMVHRDNCFGEEILKTFRETGALQ